MTAPTANSSYAEQTAEQTAKAKLKMDNKSTNRYCNHCCSLLIANIKQFKPTSGLLTCNTIQILSSCLEPNVKVTKKIACLYANCLLTFIKI